MRKTMKGLTQGATRLLVLALGLGLVTTGWADTAMTNPVTGETETYKNVFTGGTAEWNSSANWDTATTPFITTTYSPALVSNKTASTSTAVDGWTLRVGAYNGAAVTWNGGITKIQAGSVGCWLTADETSSITIASFAGNQLEGSDSAPLKLSSAKAGGITWSAGLTSASNTSLPFWYYLKGAGTVVYGGNITIANAQVIKQADITLSGTSQVTSKTLVTFGSGTTKTFTADATIKRLNSSGTDLNDNAHVATVNTTGTTTLTTSDAVGTCELVQTSTGIVLYWVDGDPAALTPTVYKPSININFTNGAGNGLTTGADVGLSGYEVPGTSWNNYVVANSTFSTVNAVDSTGAASAMSGVSVTISKTRGSWSCSGLAAASNPLRGYIDEEAGANSTPTVTVTGIPYYKYCVLVYHSTDSASVPFGYDTINGTDYTYVNDALAEGTTAWGNSGAKDSANAIAEGGNVLVTEAISGSTLTVVGHRAGGANNARGCIAAIQIIEVKPDVGENDLEIAVDGEIEHTVTAEDAEKTGTVYLTGSGTLTLAGENKISAATIDVGDLVTLVVDADRLDGTTFTGAGTVVYDGVAPTPGKGWTESSWTGTVWLKNQTVSSFEGNEYGNVNSTIRFTGVTGFLQSNTYNDTGYVHTVPLELVDDGDTVAFTYNNGWSGHLVKINTLKGTGTLKPYDKGLGEHIYIVDGSGFTGVFNLTGKYVYVGGSQPDSLSSTNPDGKLEIRSGVTMTVPSGKTWTANGGFVVNGTLNVDGTLASSHTTKAVSGAGMVVFTGRAPTVSGDAWWKNADWTGTVQVKNVTNMVGDSRTGVWLKFNDYGNSGSVVEMNNVTGWLETGYTCTVPLKITGTLYLNNGGSGKTNAFKVGTLLGSGTISGDGSADKVVFNVTDDWSGFTGTFGLNNKCIVFGSTIPDSLTAGTIYVSEGAVVTPQQTSGTWWAVGGIKVDGELRAPNLDKFGGGTTITTTDNGVFTLVTNSNADDMNVNYARIQGTGTLKLEGSAYRCISTNNFPTAMTVDNRLTAGFLHRISGLEITVGSLAGNGYLRSDWGGSAGDRDLKVLQAKDTTWSGHFWTSNPHRFRKVIVAPGANSAGTLTLSATHAAAESTELEVKSNATVKVTGKWVGATTVAGSLAFGGENETKISGNVTTADGAELDFTDFTVPETSPTSPISGALTLNDNTTIKFPAGVTFPYKLAGSFGGSSVTSLAADKYTVGGVASTVPLLLANGEAYTKVTGTFAGGENPVAWNDITWTGAAPLSGSEVEVAVSNSGTLTLGSLQNPVVATKATFNIPANTTLTLTGLLVTSEINFTGEGKVVCLEKNTLTGAIKGAATITIEYPEHVLPSMADWTSNDWKGTLVLKNCGREQNVNYYPAGETHDVVRFDQYGSANSVIRAPGYKGISAVANQNTTCPATLFIDANETIEFNHGTGESALNTNGAGFRFAKLAGTGTLRLDGTSDTAQYIFNNVAEFAGTVEITFPAEGGRKSFLFGAADNWEVMNSAYAANLVILDNMTVAAGKTWDIPAGIIIGAGKTLTLASGATVRALSKDTEGTIAVPSGTATLQGVSNAVVNANLRIGENATLNITDPSLTTLTIPADSSAGGTYNNAGTLDLSGCTSLTTLHLALGEAKTFDLSKVTLPSTCTTVYYDIGSKRDLTDYTLPSSSGGIAYYYYATETIEEYANSDSAGFTATNVPDGADVYLIRQNGMTLKAAVSGTSRTYTGGRSFAGGACWHEWDFEQSNIADRLNDTGRFFVNSQAGAVTLSTVSIPAEGDYATVRIDVQNENKRVLSSYVYPYAAIDFGTTWSAALRCSMPTVTGDGKVVAIAFGDTTSGVLGLASGADGFMELFTWAGGTYTVLAQLKVESPSDKNNMHLYVFVVNNGTVTFYRDGEFIHTAAFALGSLTRFMVGDVAGRGEAQNLPAAVASGNTGYIDYVRLYDKVLPVADVEGLSVRRPFVSAIDAYERTASLLQNWSATDAWTWKKGNNGGTVAADAPANDANVTLVADGQTDISLNLASDADYNTLIFGGNGAVGLNQTSTGTIGAQMMVVRSGVNLTVDYDAVYLTSAVVGVDEGASLAFDFSAYPFDAVTAVTTITLAGTVPAVVYDNTCASRYSVVLPDTLPAHITSAAVSWDGASYKITITPNHTAGEDVYYKEGALAAGMTVYTDAELTTATKLFAGDTLVISEASDTGDIAVDGTFNGDISVTRTAVNLTSTGTGALAGRTVTVASGKTLNFAGGSFGAMTLAGDGSFEFTGDTTAAGLSGTVGITVADGKTLTLTAATPFVSGGVSGSGTVKLPAISGSIDFNTYGYANSMVEVASVTGGELTSGDTCAPTLILDGAATFSSVGTYTFTKISGSGNLTFPAASAVTISDLVDYTGTIVNNSSTAVTVTKLTKTGVFVGGDVLLTKSSGTVNVSSVEVGGVAKQGLWDGNNFCLAAAEYDGTKYKTVAEAIAEAEEGDANIDTITIYDSNEALDAKYMFVNVGDSVKVALKPFAVVNGSTTTYHNDAQDAIIKVGMTPGNVYDYIQVIVGGSVDIPLNIFEELKIKNSGGATLNFTGIADDCTTSETALENDITKYSKSNKATAYTWTGAAFDSKTGEPDNRWAAIGNWSYVNGNDAVATASRQPQAGDSVVFNSDASVTITGSVAVESVTCGAAVTFAKYTSDITLTATTGGIVLTDAAATITVSGVTLSPAPTTTVANSYVKQTGSTYAVQAYVTVTIPSGVEHATATVNGDAVAGGASVQVDAGTDVTIAWTAASGYKITAGASQTINSIAANTKANAPTVEEMSAAVSNVNFTYGADYTSAEVTATITGDATTATLNYGGNSYNANVANGTATFDNVAVTRGNDIYAPVGYTITTDAHATTGGSGAKPAATETAWISADAGGISGGEWDSSQGGSVTPQDGKLSFEGTNTFAATSATAGDIVKIEAKGVVFNGENDDQINALAQGAVKIASVGDDVYEFRVLTSVSGGVENWMPATAAGLSPTTEGSYDIVVTFYYTETPYYYTVSVGGTPLSIASGVGGDATHIPNAQSGTTSLRGVGVLGSGSMTSLVGTEIEGNMVIDKDGTKYATIAAAITAYTNDPTIGPLTMLHSGTAPDGWKVENGELVRSGTEIVDDNAETTLVAVPAACKADKLIDTSNRYAGDILIAYNKTDKKNYTWNLNSNKEWEAATAYATSGGSSTSHSIAASAFDLTPGQAVWLTRTSSDSKLAPIRLLVSATSEHIAVEVDKGWNLVAPMPKANGAAFNAKTELSVANEGSFDTGDQIVVPTAAAPKTFERMDGKWMVLKEPEEASQPNNVPEEWGPISAPVWTEPESILIPAGKGFWFNSKDKNKSLQF